MTNALAPRLLLAMATIAALAGPIVAAPPQFDVASIRSSDIIGEGGRRESVDTAPGNLTMRNVSLRSAIKWAYRVQDEQISGPAELDSDRYDILAKAASPVADDRLRAMLQALLAERFKLKLHRQTKELSVFALTVAKNGIKFHVSETTGKSNIQLAKIGMRAERITLPELADTLSGPVQAPFVDMTNLKGAYDMTLDLSAYFSSLQKGDGAAPDIAGIVATGLQEQLGLKLERPKEPVEILVIDHAEKSPTEN
jgi:uncharacterized protein (TIGR03435 family)